MSLNPSEKPLIRLPKSLRGELKDPLGPVYTEIDLELGSGARVVTVGDIVTFHFLEAGILPDVAIVDGRTKRSDVKEEVVDRWLEIPNSVEVDNPAATITRGLVEALRESLESDKDMRIEVAGEEDLAALPAIALAKPGDIVVYGQPDEGMVFVEVDDAKKEEMIELMSRMEIEDREEFERLFG